LRLGRLDKSLQFKNNINQQFMHGPRDKLDSINSCTFMS
jgi:hypothetical protein